MTKESPLNGYSELECYKAALKLREVIGDHGRLTAKAAGKRIKMSEMQTIKLVREYYPKSMSVLPYGSSARITMRPLKGEAS